MRSNVANVYALHIYLFHSSSLSLSFCLSNEWTLSSFHSFCNNEKLPEWTYSICDKMPTSLQYECKLRMNVSFETNLVIDCCFSFFSPSSSNQIYYFQHQYIKSVFFRSKTNKMKPEYSFRSLIISHIYTGKISSRIR